MAAGENNDGSIIIDTELDQDGFEKESEKFISKIQDLTEAVEVLGDNMMHTQNAYRGVLRAVERV